MNISNWFFGAEPEAVIGTGGIYRFKDGREVDDHVYATFEYPGGRTAVFSTIESNAFERNYEVFYGTKGDTAAAGRSRGLPVRGGRGDAGCGAADRHRRAAEERRPRALGLGEPGRGRRRTAGLRRREPASTSIGSRAYRAEVSGFCAAVRTGAPLLCGPDRAIGSAIACITAVEAVASKTRLPIRVGAAAQS